MSKRVLWFIPALACIVLPAPVAAGSIPSYTTFGTLAGANFGGTGIPNNAVAITTITDGADTITLGLTAFERYLNPPLQNNGAGVFQALVGANYGDPTFHTQPSATLGATWDFGFYMSISGPGSPMFPANLTFKLLYDFNPAPGTPESALGTLNLNNAVYITSGYPITDFSTVQDSENLDESLFATPLAGTVMPPTSPSTFNPNAVGEYGLALQVFNGETELGEAGILVDVAPEPASFTLLGIGAIGLCTLRRRRKGRE